MSTGFYAFNENCDLKFPGIFIIKILAKDLVCVKYFPYRL
jgi:hypothetical protein